MERVKYLAIAAIFVTFAAAPASAQTAHMRVSGHFEQHLRVFEQHGGGRYQAYQPPRLLPRAVLQIVLGRPAGHRERQALRRAGYCSRGGELGRLPGGAVACITAIERGDRAIQTRASCPNGGYLGSVPDVDHDVCVVEHQGAGELVTVQTCPRGGHLGRVPGVDHDVCILD